MKKVLSQGEILLTTSIPTTRLPIRAPKMANHTTPCRAADDSEGVDELLAVRYSVSAAI